MLNQCRICFESDNPHDLISPCNCSGTSKYVHRECLNRWRVISNNPNSLTECNQCKFEYVMETNEISHNCLKQITSLLENHINICVFLNLLYFIFITISVSYTSITYFKYYNYHILYTAAILIYMFSIMLIIICSILCNKDIQLRLYLEYYRHIGYKKIVLALFFLILIFNFSDIIGILFTTIILRIFIINHYNIIRRLDVTSTNEILDLDTLGS